MQLEKKYGLVSEEKLCKLLQVNKQDNELKMIDAEGDANAWDESVKNVETIKKTADKSLDLLENFDLTGTGKK